MSQMTSLHERLGGLAAIEAVVESFVARAASDHRISRKFARTDVPRVKKERIDQPCEATGGPCTYTGRKMPGSHAGMKVTDGEFDAFILPLRDEIVEAKSLETGTPLPDRYRPAPRLWADRAATAAEEPE